MRASSDFQRWKHFVCAAAYLLILTAGADRARAAELQTLPESEELALREELQRIEREGTGNASAAQTMLKDLNGARGQKQARRLRDQRRTGNKRIVNGLFTSRHSAVAAVLLGDKAGTAETWCTGTLVSCNKVLTAAHCIADDPEPSRYLAYFQNSGFVKVTAIAWLSDKYAFPYADLAVLTLEKPVQGIAPIAPNAVVSPINGSRATIVGYGRTGGARLDYGIKRDGSVKFAKCSPENAGKKLLCWDFDAAINTTPGDSNTCNADSGGGVFMIDSDGERTVERLVGVVSGGRDANCIKGDNSYNTDVYEWRDWIAGEMGAGVSDRACGAGTAVDEPENIRSKLVTLDAAQPKAVYEISVPAGTTSLRVAMNGEDNGSGANDFDLLLFAGQESTVDKAACAQTDTGQFAFCEISDPRAGQWTIALLRKKGKGLAQVSTTILARQSTP